MGESSPLKKGRQGSVLYGDHVRNVAGSRGEEPGKVMVERGGCLVIYYTNTGESPSCAVKIAQLGERQWAKVLPQA